MRSMLFGNFVSKALEGWPGKQADTLRSWVDQAIYRLENRSRVGNDLPVVHGVVGSLEVAAVQGQNSVLGLEIGAGAAAGAIAVAGENLTFGLPKAHVRIATGKYLDFYMLEGASAKTYTVQLVKPAATGVEQALAVTSFTSGALIIRLSVDAAGALINVNNTVALIAALVATNALTAGKIACNGTVTDFVTNAQYITTAVACTETPSAYVTIATGKHIRFYFLEGDPAVTYSARLVQPAATQAPQALAVAFSAGALVISLAVDGNGLLIDAENTVALIKALVAGAPATIGKVACAGYDTDVPVAAQFTSTAVTAVYEGYGDPTLVKLAECDDVYFLYLSPSAAIVVVPAALMLTTGRIGSTYGIGSVLNLWLEISHYVMEFPILTGPHVYDPIAGGSQPDMFAALGSVQVGSLNPTDAETNKLFGLFPGDASDQNVLVLGQNLTFGLPYKQITINAGVTAIVYALDGNTARSVVVDAADGAPSSVVLANNVLTIHPTTGADIAAIAKLLTETASTRGKFALGGTSTNVFVAAVGSTAINSLGAEGADAGTVTAFLGTAKLYIGWLSATAMKLFLSATDAQTLSAAYNGGAADVKVTFSCDGYSFVSRLAIALKGPALGP